ncbi:hypothetical protein ACES2L_08965 [Bdellovibrio bacteriovorus]
MKELALDANHLTVRGNLRNQLYQLRALYRMALSRRKCPRQFMRDHWLIAAFIPLDNHQQGMDYLELAKKLEFILQGGCDFKDSDVWDLLLQMENKLKEIIFLA